MFTMRPDGEVHVAVQLERSAEKLPAQRNGVWRRCVGNPRDSLVDLCVISGSNFRKKTAEG
jgi:hypothetical protein